MRFGSLFSGIEAASVAWKPLGWQCRWVAEIDPFACAVLKHHYPDVPNLGDVERIDADAVEPVDLIVFGSPCQSFSVAGKRLGLDDPRGNLALVGLRLVSRVRPRWVVWENVPGVLSSDEGRDFGAFLGLLGECGYGFAYAVLDAQHFGVPQRRRRVFVVGYLGDWRPPAAVLFEQPCLHRDTAPRREPGQNAPTVPSRSTAGGGLGTDFDCDGGLIATTLAPSREEGQRIASCLTRGADSGGKGGYAAASVRKGDDNGNGGARESTLIAFGGNRRSGPIDVAAAVNAHGGPHGRLDFESETFVVIPILEAGARTGKSTTDPRAGIGIGHPGDPQFTLQAGKQHAIAYALPGTGPNVTTASRRTDIHTPLRTRAPGSSEGSTTTVIADTLRADGFDASEDGTGRGTPLTLAIRGRGDGCELEWRADGTANAILTPNGGRAGVGVGAVALPMSVRRLTPVECARLQGFPDSYLDITYRGKPAADGNKYKALGNSMAVPVIRWLGRRIALVEAAA